MMMQMSNYPITQHNQPISQIVDHT